MDQQRLIAGGSHLRHKNAVSGVTVWLPVVRMPAMQGMAHFMCQRKHRIECPLVVQENIRMRSVSAP